MNRWMCVWAFCVLVFVPDAFAWGKYGHLTICEIAYRSTTPTAREELKRLMQAHPDDTRFNHACLEADRFPRTRPAEHFVNYPRSLTDVTDAECGPAGKCIISAIKSDFDSLADATQSDEVRAKALVLLGHWVGDIHQPLHVSFADDRGGNSIRKRGRCGDNNLHAVWDNCLIEHGVFRMNAMESLLGWRRWTKAYRAADRLIDGAVSGDVQSWTTSEPWQWARESFRIVRQESVGYCTMKSGDCWYDDTRKVLGADEEPRTIQMTQAYIDQHSEIADGQLMKAGVRLAHLINLALDPDYVADTP